MAAKGTKGHKASRSGAQSTRKAEPTRTVPAAAAAATLQPDDDDGYGDDFEDYEEDDTFEAHMQAPAAKKQEHVVRSVMTRGANNAASLAFDLDALQESVKEENARSAKRVEQLRQKTPPPPALAEAKSDPNDALPSQKKKASSKKLGLKPRRHFALVDPRLNRAKKVRDLLSLKSERFVAFESLPLTPYQWYSLNLTRTGRAEKTIATRDNFCDAEEQTVPFGCHDAEMQFADGQDETDFENALRGIRKVIGSTNVARLPSFMRGAAPVVEAVLEEKIFANAASSGDTTEPLFAEWRTLPGTGDSFGKLRFASKGSVLALYGDNDTDPFGVEHNVLLRLFDASSPWTESPESILSALKGPGVASCVCLQPQRVLAGTEGGLVMMWELPKTRLVYSSACFSLTEAAHKGGILAIESVGSSFISIDAYAKICVWLLVPETLKEDDDDDLAALGAEPGATSRLKLVRALYAWTRVPARIFYPTKTYEMLLAPAQGVIDTDILSDATNEELSIDGHPMPLLSTVAAGSNPNDPLDLLFGICDYGLVFRPHSEITPDVYFANDEAREEALRGLIGSGKERSDCKAGEDAASLEMANAISQHPKIPFLFLVGQLDGATRLHMLDEQLPLRIWEPHKVDVAVVGLQWSPCRAALFFVLYSDLRLAAYDLLAQNPDQQQHAYDLAPSFDIPHRSPCFALASGSGALSSRLLAVNLGGTVQLCRLSTLATAQQETDESAGMLKKMGLDRHGDLLLPLFDKEAEVDGDKPELKADDAKL